MQFLKFWNKYALKVLTDINEYQTLEATINVGYCQRT